MPILVHFKAKNNDISYLYKNSGLSFPWVPYYLKNLLQTVGSSITSFTVFGDIKKNEHIKKKKL